MKSFIVAIFLIVWLSLPGIGVVTAQVPVTMVLTYKKDKILRDSFFFHVMKPLQAESFGNAFLYHDSLINYAEQDSSCKVTSQLAVHDTTCAYVFEMFGHEIVLVPGDTIRIEATPVQKPMIAAPVADLPSRTPGLYSLVYAGSNKWMYEFGDSLTRIAGDLRFDAITFKKSDTLLHFLDKVQRLYEVRINFLKAYTQRHHVPAYFFSLMSTEITSAFIINLCSPFVNSPGAIANYPKKTLAMLDSCLFNNEQDYYRTALYADYALAVSDYDALRALNSGEDRYIQNYKLLKSVERDTLRNHLLTNFLFKHAPIMLEQYDTLIRDYERVCSNGEYKLFLRNHFNKLKREQDKINHLTVEDALHAKLFDSAGKAVYMKDLLKGKPAIIDCWATWCVPCLKEIPAEKRFEAVYGHSVNFIYLSYDRSVLVWQKGSRNFELQNSYYLDDGFRSDFTKYFRINSIPRYIVVDRNGNIVSPDAYRPSMKKKFRDMLEQLIRS